MHFADLDADVDVSSVGPVPVTAPARTFQDCVTDAVPPDRVDQAARELAERGLVSKAELEAIRAGATATFFAFCGVPPVGFRVYPVATHVAEKLHAYTLPRDRENTRVKDLPDLALLSTISAAKRSGPSASNSSTRP